MDPFLMAALGGEPRRGQGEEGAADGKGSKAKRKSKAKAKLKSSSKHQVCKKTPLQQEGQGLPAEVARRRPRSATNRLVVGTRRLKLTNF